jgi:hypothetical protein
MSSTQVPFLLVLAQPQVSSTCRSRQTAEEQQKISVFYFLYRQYSQEGQLPVLRSGLLLPLGGGQGEPRLIQ